MNRSSRAQPGEHLRLVGRDLRAGFEFQQTSAATGGSSSPVSASPSCDMLIVRAAPVRRSSRLSAYEPTAAAVAVGM